MQRQRLSRGRKKRKNIQCQLSFEPLYVCIIATHLSFSQVDERGMCENGILDFQGWTRETCTPGMLNLYDFYAGINYVVVISNP